MELNPNFAPRIAHSTAALVSALTVSVLKYLAIVLQPMRIFPRHILVGHALSARTECITNSLTIETALEAIVNDTFFHIKYIRMIVSDQFILLYISVTRFLTSRISSIDGSISISWFA